MSVTQRKLFSSKGARSKLRDMGGIMSSFPELSDEVQNFADGTEVVAPTDPRFRSFRNIPQTLSQIPRALSEIPSPFSSLEDYPFIQDLLNQSLPATAYRVPSTSAVDGEPPVQGSQVEELVDRVRRTLSEDAPATGDQRTEEAEADIVAGDDDRVEELVDRVRETLGFPGSEEGAGEGEGAGAGRDEPTLRSRAEDRIKLFQDLFGADEPSARDRAMQFAMIGLAVAAGQSPNALTNLASGLLAGTEAMSEQESARREQDRGLRTSAVQSVLDELAAQREAAARSGTRFQDTESYVDAVVSLTELLVKEDGLPAEAAKIAAEGVLGPLYGVRPPSDEPPPAGVPSDATPEDLKLLGYGGG